MSVPSKSRQVQANERGAGAGLAAVCLRSPPACTCMCSMLLSAFHAQVFCMLAALQSTVGAIQGLIRVNEKCLFILSFPRGLRAE